MENAQKELPQLVGRQTNNNSYFQSNTYLNVVSSIIVMLISIIAFFLKSSFDKIETIAVQQQTLIVNQEVTKVNQSSMQGQIIETKEAVKELDRKLNGISRR